MSLSFRPPHHQVCGQGLGPGRAPVRPGHLSGRHGPGVPAPLGGQSDSCRPGPSNCNKQTTSPLADQSLLLLVSISLMYTEMIGKCIDPLPFSHSQCFPILMSVSKLRINMKPLFFFCKIYKKNISMLPQ